MSAASAKPSEAIPHSKELSPSSLRISATVARSCGKQRGRSGHVD